MSELPTIVCAVDFSDHSRRALQYAVLIARHSGARLTVLNIVDPMLVNAASLYHTDLKTETREDLAEFLTATAPDLKTQIPAVKVLVFMGSAASEILRIAREEHADLIVMGTHGLSGYRKVFFGSTTEGVLRHTDVPVLVVPLGEGEVPSSIGDTPMALRSILAPVDFSEASDEAARLAARLAGTLAARLVLVHAVAPVHAIARWQEQARAQARHNRLEAEKRLSRFAGSLELATPPGEEVRLGAPADIIAAVAAERHADLIVMALRGAGGPLGASPGAVAYRVLCLSDVPVLALPAGSAGFGIAVRQDATAVRQH